MTTTVKIECGASNECGTLVSTLQGEQCIKVADTLLAPGESCSLPLFRGQKLLLEEVPRPPQDATKRKQKTDSAGESK